VSNVPTRKPTDSTVADDGVGFRKDILVIVPTRSRPENSVAFADAFFSYASGRANLLFALDDDDPVPYPRIGGALYEVNPRLRLAGTHNLVAATYRDDYQYLAFLDDDQLIRTLDWDHLLADAIRHDPAGIAVAGDPENPDGLSSAVLMRAAIARTLGYVVPPDLIHDYRVAVWHALGRELGSLRTVDGMTLDHPERPEQPSATEGRVHHPRDRAAYERYTQSRLKLDADRIRTVLLPTGAQPLNPDRPPTATAGPLPQSRPPAKPASPPKPSTTNDVLVIVPTRSRPDNSLAFAETFFAHSTCSDLLFGLDDDDPEDYPRIPGVIYEVNPRLRVIGTLNLLATKYMNHYEYLAFLGDDHYARTPGWDRLLVEAIADIPHGVAYGNDLFMGENLPTAVLMKSSIVRTLGYMAPPTLTHLYPDNFWLEIGKGLGSIRYLGHVIIEHMHYTIGKAEPDAVYLEANSNDNLYGDAVAFEAYKRDRLESDLALLRRSQG
jgi:hypothetical protein